MLVFKVVLFQTHIENDFDLSIKVQFAWNVFVYLNQNLEKMWNKITTKKPKKMTCDKKKKKLVRKLINKYVNVG